MQWLKRLFSGVKNKRNKIKAEDDGWDHLLGSTSISEDEFEMPSDEEKDKDPPGYLKGRHYTEYVEEIKELKRSGEHQKVIRLLLRIIDSVEKEAEIYKAQGLDGYCASGYYEHLAIIYRKEQKYMDEIAVLERLKKRNKYLPKKLSDRLTKARALYEKNNSA